MVSIGRAWGVDTKGQVFAYQLNKNNEPVLPDAPTGVGLKQVSVTDDGTVWAINSNDYLCRHTGKDQWQSTGHQFRVISVQSAAFVYGIGMNNNTGWSTNNGANWSWNEPHFEMDTVSVGVDPMWGTKGGKAYHFYGRWLPYHGDFKFKKIANGGYNNIWALTEDGSVLRRRVLVKQRVA